jgi:hypothetical protein
MRKVSFDFDYTLGHLREVQEYATELISKGFDVHIVTSRFDSLDKYDKAGVWLSDGKSSHIYPQFMDELIDALEWEITEEEVNCDKLIGFEFIDNCNEP